VEYKVITGTLEAKTAVHIGTGASNELTDALIRRDNEGQPFIPGTAIAGALRALLTRLAPRLGKTPCNVLNVNKEQQSKPCNCAVCNLFGDINPSDENDSTSEASRLLVFNAHQQDEGLSYHPIIRDSVGIDRSTGTAARADGIKFDLEVIPAGTTFKLRIELRDIDNAGEQLLAAGLSEWTEGRLKLGGRVARGLGSFKLTGLQYKTMPLDNAEQLMSFLREDKPWKNANTSDGWFNEHLEKIKPVKISTDMPETISRGWFSLQGILQAEGPLLTNDILSVGTSGFDHAPALSQLHNWLNPVLTGASLRGVFRSHAERLARTLTTLQAKDKGDFLSRCPACDPNVREQDKTSKLPLESCDSLIKKYNAQANNKPEKQIDEPENITDSLCLACRLFGSTRLGSGLIIEDAPYHQSTNSQSKPEYKMLDFLAIDRFTGGGVDGAKFDALALWKPAFRLNLYLENPEPWELGWLWLVIRDLAAGWLTVGFGSAKGLGKVGLTNWKATFGYLHPEDAPLGLIELNLQTQKCGIYTTKTITLNTDKKFDMIQKWVNCFIDEVINFQRLDSIILTEDSYFDDIKDIYSDKGGAP